MYRPHRSNVNGKPGNENVKPSTYASLLNDKTSTSKVSISSLHNNEVIQGADIAIPLDSVNEISNRYANTLYGYFIGKRHAFPVVENYVKNTWAKFGLERVMLRNGFFLFQFSSKKGMEQLKKDEINLVPVWVKLHSVPIVAFSETGLSLISTKLGHPIMLDAYTSSMCVTSWGRNNYARILIEVSVVTALLTSLVVAIPYPNGKGHSLETVEVEYEWQPPHCVYCKIFGHSNEQCPKQVREPVNVAKDKQDDDFTVVTNRKNKGKKADNNHPRCVEGLKLNKPKATFVYRQKEKPGTSTFDNAISHGHNGGSQHQGTDSTSIPKDHVEESSSQPSQCGTNVPIFDDINFVSLKNSFAALKNADNFFDANEETSKATNSRDPKDDSDSEVEEAHIDSVNDAIVRKGASTPSNDTDSEVEEMILEEPKGASTPSSSVPDVYVCAILESHVDISALSKVCTKVFRTWDWTSNANLCSKGCRIIVGWNLEVVDVLVVNITSQVMHVKITHRETKGEIFCSFVYAANLPIERRKLWSDLDIHKNVVRGKAWVLLGDFNVALNLEDSFSSSSQLTSHIAYAIFQPYRISDHSSVVLKILDLVDGHNMYQIATKLKSLKKPFHRHLHEQGNLHDRVNRLWHELDEVQKAPDNNLADSNLRDEEEIYLKAFNEAKLDEERQNQQRRIKMVLDVINVEVSGPNIPNIFVSHYEMFLGTSMHCDDLNVDGLFTKMILDDVCSNMVTTVTNLEIKEAMFGTGDDRAPGPDGFTSAFFKKVGTL
ncbi:zinc knuckle CX2CX4HX4C containing protein [Tanacetum coccineum]